MKRILAFLLVLVMCVGIFASCKPKEEGPQYDVDSAASYLYEIQIKDLANKETPNDFDLVAKVVRDGVTYTVTWTSNSDKVTITESSKGANFVTVNVPENNDEEFTYKLTATVKDPDGKTAVKEVTLKVPFVKAEEGVVKAPVEGVAYKLNIDQKALERNIYALSTFKSGKLEATNDPKKATDYFVELTDGGYYIYAMVNGAKKYLSYAQVPNPNGGYYDNVVYTDAATSVWAYDSEYSVWYVSHDAATFGLGAYSTNEAFGISGINFFKDPDKKDGQYPAKFMTKEYAETLEPETGVTGPEELEKDTLLTLAQASEFALNFLHNTYSDNKYYVEGKITNIDNSKGYGNLIIADDNGGSLTIYGSYINGLKYGDANQNVELKVGDVVKLYGRLGQYNNVAQMKNADVVLINGEEPDKAPSVDITVEEFLAMAFALEVNAEEVGPFTFDGVVVGRSEDGYDNVIVALGGQTDKGIMCYRLTDSALTVGTEFNFTAGRVKNYNGTVEFMDVVVNSIGGVKVELPEVPENYTGAQLVEAIYQLQNGQKLAGPYTLTGVVSEITEAYSTQYGNATFTIIVDGLTDKPILCYRVKGDKAAGLAVGDTVTITGAFTNYGGKYETVQGEANVTNVVKGQGGTDNPGTDNPGTDAPSINLPDSYKATLDMMGSTNVVEITADKSVYTANGITYTNNKSSSTTPNSNYSPTEYAARAYQGSKFTVEYAAGFTTVVIIFDDYQSGKYMTGLDNATIAGATIARDGDTLVIVFAESVTSFTTPDLATQLRIESISVADSGSVSGGTTGGNTPGTDNPGTGSGNVDTPTVDVPTSFKATLDMMGSTNVVEITEDKSVYAANGITYTNNKSSSITPNSNYSPTEYAARAYQGSTVTVEYAEGFTTVVIVLDDYQSGKYLVGFDNMEIAGATITRNNDTVIITFAQAVTSFTTPDLPKQARIESISVA